MAGRRRGSPELAERLRATLVTLHHRPEGREALDLGLVDRYDAIADRDYDAVRLLDRQPASTVATSS